MLQFCYRPLPLKAFAAPYYCFSQACNFQVLDIGADFSFFFLGLAKDELSPTPFLPSLPPVPLQVGPLNTAGGALQAPAVGSGAYWSQKVQFWWQQFLLIS